MTERIDCLYKLYENSQNPCICFSEDFKVLWLNGKAKTAFPDMSEGNSIEEHFPYFSFSQLSSENFTSIKLENNYDKNDLLEILSFKDENAPTLYIGIYYEAFAKAINSTTGEGVKLLSYYIRQRMTSIFNLSELISKKLAENEDLESSHHLRDIERNCRLLLKLSSNFNAYYTIAKESEIYKVKTNFHEFLVPIMNQAEAILAPTNLTFVFDPDYQNGVVELDKSLFAVAVLNIINTSYLYTKEQGALVCKTEFSNDEMLFTFEDNVTDCKAILSSDYSATTVLDATGEPPAIKKMCYDILTKTVELHGGECVIVDNNPGIKILIRMKATLIDKNYLSDESNYNKNYSVKGKLGIVDIMLSDVTY